MNWWQRWKAKHWDETWVENDPASPVVFIGMHRPPLRRFFGWFGKHWRQQPLNFLMLLLAVIGTIATVIGLFH